MTKITDADITQPITVDVVSIAISDDKDDAPYTWVRLTFSLRDGQTAAMDIGPIPSPALADERVELLKQALTPSTTELENL
jgi:hypothetical protein